MNVITHKINAFFLKYKAVYYKKNELILRSIDSDFAYIYYIQNGFVSQNILSDNGAELIVNIHRLSSFFPMESAINNQPNIYNFRSMTPTKIIYAPKEEVIEFVKKNKDVLYDLTRKFGRGINFLTATIKYLSSDDANRNIYNSLLLLGKRFGRKQNRKYLKIDFPLTHRNIAALVGLSRETVSRELSLLKWEKLIKKKGRFLLVKTGV